MATTITLTDAQVSDVITQSGAGSQIADLQAQVANLTAQLATTTAQRDSALALISTIKTAITNSGL